MTVTPDAGETEWKAYVLPGGGLRASFPIAPDVHQEVIGPTMLTTITALSDSQLYLVYHHLNGDQWLSKLRKLLIEVAGEKGQFTETRLTSEPCFIFSAGHDALSVSTKACVDVNYAAAAIVAGDVRNSRSQNISRFFNAFHLETRQFQAYSESKRGS